ncbi:L-threonine 3-dehydrogenase [Diplonema papillatum]|nr:L-threonine 3-dehydrogenase [Diplonema papillatum]
MSSRSMKVLMKSKDVEGYEYTESPVPEPTAHQALVRITKVGICGSDIPLYMWNDIGKGIATLPFIPGHEAVGEIVAIGAGAQPENAGELKKGDRVGVENHYYCEACYQCTHGEPHICSKMGQLGHGKLGHGPGMDKTIAMQGGCAEFALVPTKMLYKLKRDITDTQACLLEPMGVAHNGVEAAEVKKGDDVLIIGCGAIGLLAIQICKAIGASPIYAADIDEKKLALAREFGATHTFNTRASNLTSAILGQTQSFGVGHLVECSGFPGMVNKVWEMVRKGGNVCLLGIPKTPVAPELSGKDFLFRCVTTRGVHGRKIWHTWEACEALIADGKCKPELVVTHDFPLEDFQNAFDTLLKATGIKILMTPTPSGSKM